MEQRVGRIDRVNSQAERRLTSLNAAVTGEHKLQVYYPHLKDTVEVLQVRRVLARLNRFLRLMHRDLGTPDPGEQRIDIAHEIQRLHEDIQPITEPLHSAFPIRDEILQGTRGSLAVEPSATARLLRRFEGVKHLSFKRLQIDWEAQSHDGTIMGTVRLERRQQPFALIVRSMGGASWFAASARSGFSPTTTTSGLRRPLGTVRSTLLRSTTRSSRATTWPRDVRSCSALRSTTSSASRH